MKRPRSRSFRRQTAPSPAGLKDRTYRLIFEMLEDRTMLSTSSQLPPAMVLGGAGDAVNVADGHAVAVVLRRRGSERPGHDHVHASTTSRPTPRPGVLLTDTLAAGVTPRPVPRRQPRPERPEPGLEPGDDPGVRPRQRVDDGQPARAAELTTPARHRRQAYATLDAGAVSATTPAATLQPGNVSDPSLLASTRRRRYERSLHPGRGGGARLRPDARSSTSCTPRSATTRISDRSAARGGRSGATPATRSTSPAWAWP